MNENSSVMGEIHKIAQKVFQIESKAVADLVEQLTTDFENAISCLLECKGRIVICGIGKSGLVGKKIAATLASTGSPSFFLHPSEAIHGDLGSLMSDDCFISISYSGETDEILQLLPYIQQLKIPHIALVGNVNSTLAQNADWTLDIRVKAEASPISLVPLASTIASMAMGDAIATALIILKNFGEKDFAKNHPGGTLGKKLVTKVASEMQIKDLPTALKNTPVKDVLLVMSSGMFGMVVIVDKSNFIKGVITDGDLRRALNKCPSSSFFDLCADDLMTQKPITIQADCLLWEAEQMMMKYKITTLIIEKEGCLAGIIAKHQIK
ncbi:KpsF/GutQ family sugar-phosphate isomerase [Aureispira]|nr:KpsF/GutQ family sugar-phosphate isomerase [Aureispira sp.]